MAECLQPMRLLPAQPKLAGSPTLVRGKAEITMLMTGQRGTLTQSSASNPTLDVEGTPREAHSAHRTGAATLLAAPSGTPLAPALPQANERTPHRRASTWIAVSGILLALAGGGLYFALQWKPKTLDAFLQTLERHRASGDSDAAQQELALGLKYFPDAVAREDWAAAVAAMKISVELFPQDAALAAFYEQVQHLMNRKKERCAPFKVSFFRPGPFKNGGLE